MTSYYVVRHTHINSIHICCGPLKTLDDARQRADRLSKVASATTHVMTLDTLYTSLYPPKDN